MMKAVLQRVAEASVEVSGEMIASTGRGLLLLIGADQGDSEKNADSLADRCLRLRIFEDDEGKMNRSVIEVGGDLLAVSQFTLSADLSKGRRPSFNSAMKPPEAERLFDYFVEKLKESGLDVKTGRFGAKMNVRLINDGPVTFVLEG
jgi:D-tyrosyl-tRNA(Tyr) deacylase